MVWEAYVDDSLEKNEVLVLAGYLATDEKWAAFAKEWQERLDMRPHWSQFKMREIAAANSEMQWERAEWFYRVIEGYVSGQIAVAIPIKPLKRIVRELGLPEGVENPYHAGFKSIINLVAQDQIKMGLSDPVNFVFDIRSEQAMVELGFDVYLNSMPDEMKRLTGAKPRFRDDTTCLPLQGADLLAWWVRKLWLEKGTIIKGELGFPWSSKRDIPRMWWELDDGAYQQHFGALLVRLREVGMRWRPSERTD